MPPWYQCWNLPGPLTLRVFLFILFFRLYVRYQEKHWLLVSALESPRATDLWDFFFSGLRCVAHGLLGICAGIFLGHWLVRFVFLLESHGLLGNSAGISLGHWLVKLFFFFWFFSGLMCDATRTPWYQWRYLPGPLACEIFFPFSFFVSGLRCDASRTPWYQCRYLLAVYRTARARQAHGAGPAWHHRYKAYII